MDESVFALVRVLIFFVSVYFIPSGLVTRLARIGRFSARTRRMLIWLFTLIAAGLIVYLMLWVGTVIPKTEGGPFAAILIVFMIAGFGWGFQYLGLRDALRVLRVQSVREGTLDIWKEWEEHGGVEPPPCCRDGLPPALKEVPQFTGTFEQPRWIRPFLSVFHHPSGPYTLTFTGITAYACPDEPGVFRPPIRNFFSELYYSLCFWGTLPAVERGSCPICKAKNGIPHQTMPGTLVGIVRLPGISPFRVVYEGPVLACVDCRSQYIRFPNDCEFIGYALKDALKNVGMKERWADRLRF